MKKRILIVILSLITIWALFAPKSYGQSKKPDSCSIKYRWVEKGVKYKELKDSSSLSLLTAKGIYLDNQFVNGLKIAPKPEEISRIPNGEENTIQINDNPKNPIQIKIGDEVYIVWKKKIYRQVYKQPKTIK